MNEIFVKTTILFIYKSFLLRLDKFRSKFRSPKNVECELINLLLSGNPYELLTF